MRTIKFRGKRLDNGEWVYGSLSNHGGNCIIFDHNDPDFDWHEVDPETVGQLMDTTINKELLSDSSRAYEGDLLDYKGELYHLNNDGFQWRLGPVNLSGNGIVIDYDVAYESKLIGNIHDNPERLK